MLHLKSARRTPRTFAWKIRSVENDTLSPTTHVADGTDACNAGCGGGCEVGTRPPKLPMPPIKQRSAAPN